MNQMPKTQVKSLAKQANTTVADVEKKFKQAKKIAADMGQAGNWAYITDTVENLLGIDEAADIIGSFLAEKYLESPHLNYDDFIEEMSGGAVTTSGDFQDTPEVVSKKKKCKKCPGACNCT